MMLYYCLKFMFVILLFLVFSWKFALPSFLRYLNSGLIVETSLSPRQPSDKPTITICAKNAQNGLSWKNIKNGRNTLEKYCNFTKIEDAFDCINRRTYNMTEAILKTSQKNGSWIQEMSNDGEVFIILNSIFKYRSRRQIGVF